MIKTPFLHDTDAISFGEKLAGSEQFLALFDEGMDLVTAAAAYLEGDGRTAAKRLPRQAAIGYAIESMRLTTRLIQIAAWLLLQRAVNEGELTKSEAAAEKVRIRLAGLNTVSEDDVFALLPPRLQVLIEASLRLQARVLHLDALFYRRGGKRGREPLGRNPVLREIDRLRSAFTPQEQAVS
jgi:regulator of CtrA degradation